MKESKTLDEDDEELYKKYQETKEQTDEKNEEEEKSTSRWTRGLEEFARNGGIELKRENENETLKMQKQKENEESVVVERRKRRRRYHNQDDYRRPNCFVDVIVRTAYVDGFRNRHGRHHARRKPICDENRHDRIFTIRSILVR